MPKRRPSDGPNLDLTLPDVGLDFEEDLEEPGEAAEPQEPPVQAATDAVAAYKSAFQLRAKSEQRRLTLSTDSEYWVCVCFETREQKEAFLKRMKLADLGDKHIDGIEVARRLGVPFSKEERVTWPRRRGHGTLSKLVH